MTYLSQAAGAVHSVTVEMRVASGGYQVSFSSAKGATYPLLNMTSVGAQLNPLTTRRTLAGIDVEVANTPDVQALMAPGFSVQTFLDSEATQTDATLKVKVGGAAALTAALGAFPFDLHVGAETVTVTGSAVGPDFDTLNVTRGSGAGHYRSDPIGHPMGTPCGASPQAWPGRTVAEVLIYPNGDERLVALYACDGIPSYRDGVWSLPMQDGLGFYNRTIGRGMGTARVAAHAAASNDQYLILDGARFASSDAIAPAEYHLTPGGFIFDGHLIESRQRTGNASGVALGNDIFVWPWWGQRGRIIEGPLPAVGDTLEPVVILENSAANVVLGLLTSIKGDGANGPYDFFYGNDEAQIGVGIPSFRVNAPAILRALSGSPRMRVIIEPGALLLDVMERELSWLGLYLDTDQDGLITVREVAYPVSVQDCDHQLTDTSLHASASEELRVSGRLINRVTLKADYDPADKEHRLEMNLPGILTTENQLGEAVSFDPTWLPRPANVLQLALLEETLGLLVSRWGIPRPEFATEYDWTQHLVRVGDTAGVVNPRLPDSNGGQGVSLGCLVTAVESDLDAGLVRITAEAVGSTRGGYFCPAGEVQNVAGVGGGVYDLTLNPAASSRLVSGLLEAGTEASEAEYFAPGWGLAGYAYATGVVAWTGEAQSITGNVLRVSATVLPVVGQVVAPDSYGTFGSAPATMPALDPIPGNRRPGLQPDATGVAYLWLADAAHTLGPASDPPKEWI